jgi:hypothetical protein
MYSNNLFSKNDLKTLPFDQIPVHIKAISERLQAEKLHVYKAGLEAANSRKLKQYTKDMATYFDSEAGSDGVEEAVREVANFEDPEDMVLPEEAKHLCRIEARSSVINSFIAAMDLGSKWTWLLPQLQAHFGNNVKPIKNASGLYDGKLTIGAVEDNFTRGLWYIAQWSRSDLIKGTPLYKVGEYNNLVPLLLSAYKQHHGILYTAWDRTNLRFIVDEELCKAMLAEVPDLKPEQILEIRNDCLKVNSGAKIGQIRNPVTTAMLYGIREYTKYPLAEIPKYALVMLAQIWCAHPNNRTAKMVLDPKDWDTMPLPIIDQSVIPKDDPFKNKKATLPAVDFIPW